MADIEIRLKSLVKEPFFHVPWKVQYTCERIAARLSRTLNLRPCNVTKENIRDLFRKVGGIFVVNNYVPFDKRREEEYKAKDNMKDYAFCLAEFGNMVYCDGLNNKGIPTGFEWGDFTLNDTNSSRYNFIPLDYEPKEGELIYYLRKSILGEIHWKNTWAWDHLGTHKYHINYKADHRKVYESWFKEYD